MQLSSNHHDSRLIQQRKLISIKGLSYIGILIYKKEYLQKKLI